MTKKKYYRKPAIKQVDLVPEEAVLTACKLSMSSGKAGPAPNCWKSVGVVCRIAGS